ncbi:hypothetical protein RJT34_20318 [Clitoria ternatea]|uniref:Uncharacterized protein n=1 Tax=Clitoria ternatea TaxID=43366 RepID=A0AAN9P4T2_CLITE
MEALFKLQQDLAVAQAKNQVQAKRNIPKGSRNRDQKEYEVKIASLKNVATLNKENAKLHEEVMVNLDEAAEAIQLCKTVALESFSTIVRQVMYRNPGVVLNLNGIYERKLVALGNNGD